jgi:SAM-dependent methyltransferase
MGYDEAFAAVYDRYFGDYAEKASPVLLRYFASQALSRKDPSILDLGCGTGRLALRFLDAGYRVTGLDLSPHMLSLAESSCAKHLVAGTARFLQADMSDFPPPGPFGMVVCTYNGMNHLEDPERMKGCFRSVRACLPPGGTFLFDYHTRKGLKEWAYSESTEWEEGLVEVTGWFKEAGGRAAMRLQGRYQGRAFDETLSNRTFPLGEVRDWLGAEGFRNVLLTEMLKLGEPLTDPEEHKRITVIAS